MKMKDITAAELKKKQDDVLEKVSAGKNTFIIIQDGVAQAALISIEDYRLLHFIRKGLSLFGETKVGKKVIRKTKRTSDPLKRLAKEFAIDLPTIP